jgi:membrane protein YqaA with SNARE-associated domain
MGNLRKYWENLRGIESPVNNSFINNEFRSTAREKNISSEPAQKQFENHIEAMTAKTYLSGAAMVILGIIGVYTMFTPKHINPLLTIFLYSIPSNCAISLFPHEPVLVWYGKTVNLWYLSVAATLGTVLSSYLDYKFFTPVLNLSYSAKYKATNGYKTAHKWFYKFPFISLIIAGFTPVPFYPFKFMVYSSKYPLWKYQAAVILGRFPRYYLLAWAGLAFHVPNWMIFAGFVGMIGLVYAKKISGWITRPMALLFNGRSER